MKYIISKKEVENLLKTGFEKKEWVYIYGVNQYLKNKSNNKVRILTSYTLIPNQYRGWGNKQ